MVKGQSRQQNRPADEGAGRPGSQWQRTECRRRSASPRGIAAERGQREASGRDRIPDRRADAEAACSQHTAADIRPDERAVSPCPA